MAPRIFFWVQHLLGIGHLKRTATLSRAFSRAGMDVTIVSGGHDVPGLDVTGAKLIQLPPVRAADKHFKTLVDENGLEIDEAFYERRRGLLLQAYEACSPDAVITELFPFGRRQLRNELTALLDAAKTRPNRPLIVSSVRDILVKPPKPQRVEEMLSRIETYYDRILIHGDPKLIPFGDTFGPADRISDIVAYSGYVVDTPKKIPGGPGADEVIVSAGGGAVSEELFRAAMLARKETELSDRLWRILVGHALPQAIFDQLKEDAPEGIAVERARADFTTLMANCTLSISQGGYNTVMEMLAAQTRGVIVPYAGGLETEQTLRARLLEDRNGIRSIKEDQLSPQALAHAVNEALAAPPPDISGLKANGADTSAHLLSAWLEQHCRTAT
ncbi:MAG: UDP-N-acetylglucosamine--N-acetylmuramyl-(pentapeptide) pyrophosphoryl-undecaprenol N-acetylglucosamine transferase [Alphaproteobacteria bacterium MarineAlpha11_Bin1]|nr:MAG: UDP-N-acetylglucosamine--N-acetylmuramyl-(pentapeptide) pyrophosphoryl-undecaprenol N-acetylglucosamine transferase [Alphaproteobacteria bacterium MarineAlpha11_Bin1]|tara:strand:- start:34544 stop:35704 length:1161 start_codon:yes stop_codon:yes gene_type:complete